METGNCGTSFYMMFAAILLASPRSFCPTNGTERERLSFVPFFQISPTACVREAPFVQLDWIPKGVLPEWDRVAWRWGGHGLCLRAEKTRSQLSLSECDLWTVNPKPNLTVALAVRTATTPQAEETVGIAQQSAGREGSVHALLGFAKYENSHHPSSRTTRMITRARATLNGTT